MTNYYNLKFFSNTMSYKTKHLKNKHHRILVALVCVCTILLQNVFFACTQTKEPKYEKIVLSDTFHGEGSCIGDFN